MQDAFTVGGEKLRYPGDPAGSPWNTINCRCTTLPVLDDMAAGPQQSIGELPPLGEFKTLEQATEWARQEYPDIDWDFTGAHVDTINPSLRQWHELAQKYPEVAKGLKFFGTGAGEGPGSRYAFKEGDTAYARAPAGHAIVLNPKWYGSPQDFASSLQSCTVVGRNGWRWHPAGCDSFESVITHEFGHQFDWWLRHQYDKAFSPIVGMDGFGNVGTTWDSWCRKQSVTKGLSTYAKRNEVEKIAESFSSMYHTPKAKQAAIVKRMQKLLDTMGNPEDWLDKGEWEWHIPGDPEHRAILSQWQVLREAINW